MTSRTFLASLVAGAIGMCNFTAAEQPPPKLDHRQADEEKTEQRLADLAGSCRKMLARQMAVYDGTRRLHEAIQNLPDKSPRLEDRQASLKLAADQRDIVMEVTKVIDMLEAETAAIAFPEVFRELRKEMERIQYCLRISEVSMDTQDRQQDIISTLRDSISDFRSR
jgi:hypothetical protein